MNNKKSFFHIEYDIPLIFIVLSGLIFLFLIINTAMEILK